MTPPADPGQILVPLDGSPQALVAVPVARELARILGSIPRVVYAGARPVAPAELPGRVGLSREQLEGFEVEQTLGDPADRILELATRREPAAIVMCSRTRGNKKWVGPVVERVLPVSPAPVVLVNPERGLAPWRLQEVLLPYDGTPSTAEALAPAATLAGRAGAHLYVLYVADPHGAPSLERGALAAPRYVDQPQHEWPVWAGEFLDRLTCACDFDVARLHLLVARGRPGPEIVRVAHEHGIDLTVLAWKGRLERHRAKTAMEIVRRAESPILVLRTRPGEPPPSPPT